MNGRRGSAVGSAVALCEADPDARPDHSNSRRFASVGMSLVPALTSGQQRSDWTEKPRSTFAPKPELRKIAAALE